LRVFDTPSSVTLSAQNGLTTFHVGVTDEEAVEAKLLRLVLQDPEVSVTDFRRKSYALEEIFMQLIEENSHDR
jgi:hypothetical protein